MEHYSTTLLTLYADETQISLGWSLNSVLITRRINRSVPLPEDFYSIYVNCIWVDY